MAHQQYHRRALQRLGASAGRLPPIACTAVRVWEATPPQGTTPLEWILLCDAPVTACAKALKTGLGVEKLQLEKATRLFAAAIMRIVALRLVGLREQFRNHPQRPAEAAGLEPLALELLRTATAEVALAISRLGGYLNRRKDAPRLANSLVWHEKNLSFSSRAFA